MRIREIKVGAEVIVKARKTIKKSLSKLVGKTGYISDVYLNRGKIKSLVVVIDKNSYCFNPSELYYTGKKVIINRPRQFGKNIERKRQVTATIKIQKITVPTKKEIKNFQNQPFVKDVVKENRNVVAPDEIFKGQQKPDFFVTDKVPNSNGTEETIDVFKAVSCVFSNFIKNNDWLNGVRVTRLSDNAIFKIEFVECDKDGNIPVAVKEPDIEEKSLEKKVKFWRIFGFVFLFLAYIMGLFIYLVL